MLLIACRLLIRGGRGGGEEAALALSAVTESGYSLKRGLHDCVTYFRYYFSTDNNCKCVDSYSSRNVACFVTSFAVALRGPRDLDL